MTDVSAPSMDNKSASPLRVPGFGDLPLDQELPVEDRFAHGFREWKQVPAITLREFAMVAAMNDVTDKPGWHVDIFSPDVADRWRDEILASTPLMSHKAWEWCVAELRDKATYFQATGHVRVLDTGSCVCKSDVLGGPELCADFRSGIQSVLAQRDEPGRDGVASYVDPALYPLVWGKSRVLAHGGHVTRQGDIIASSPNSVTAAVETAPRHGDKRTHSDTVQERMATLIPKPWEYVFNDEDATNIKAYCWSYKYQWLPSEVEFDPNSIGTDVRLTSYINGLDLSPACASLYESLEKLISLSIEPWNDCLIKGQAGWNELMTKLPNDGWAPPGNVRKQCGRVPCRIITYGVEWENEAPDWVSLFDGLRRRRLQRYLDKVAEVAAIEQEKPPKDADRRTRIKHRLRLKEAQFNISKEAYLAGVEQLPEPTPEQWTEAQEYLERAEPGSDAPTVLPEGWEQDVHTLLEAKIRRLLHYKHPEPGSAFSYDKWKAGTHGGKAIVDMVTDRPIDPAVTPPFTPHTPYTIRLQDQFRSQGLQVITRIQGISLDPENPEYPGGRAVSGTLPDRRTSTLLPWPYLPTTSKTSPRATSPSGKRRTSARVSSIGGICTGTGETTFDTGSRRISFTRAASWRPFTTCLASIQTRCAAICITLRCRCRRSAAWLCPRDDWLRFPTRWNRGARPFGCRTQLGRGIIGG
jgi:hypothetical protein